MTAAASLRLERVPDLSDLFAAQPDLYSFLLESTAPGPLGRYSMLLRTSGEELCLSKDGTLTGPGDSSRFLGRLKQWYLSESEDPVDSPRLPFIGGWFIYLGYELAQEIEPILDLPASPCGLPVALAVRCDGAVIIEHGSEESAHLVAERPDVLEAMRAELNGVVRSPVSATPTVVCPQPESSERFRKAVKRIQRYLAAGDVFQVNISRAWAGDAGATVDPVAIYHRLRRSNPAPFSGMMRRGESTLLSSSPERLVEVRGRQVQTRPIAGTYPRGEDRESDRALSLKMLAHPKERAEHIMLIDLERNDLGRICETGSVKVSELMTIESYAHVHHIVSNVNGQLKAGATPVDAISAVFPGGTITGCPKVRCMQIIAELEQAGRGFYTGSMGYISKDGQMDLNILIRSMLIEGGRVTLRTGAGIVADSRPGRELAETVAKAKGMLQALEAGDE